MKFGQVDNPRKVDFTIPPDHPDTAKVLKAGSLKSNDFKVYVGCAKWNKQDLKNFFPRGVRDELAYYATQFNSIELNATFYRLFPPTTFDKWRKTVPNDFRFFPKLEQSISHFRRLNDVAKIVDRNVAHMSRLGDKLEMAFLQMHDNFGPKDFDRVVDFVENWTYDVPLAIEFRHTAWYNDRKAASKLYDLIEAHGITNVLVDTAGRRDLMHMRLTTPTAFVRWVGANDPDSDRCALMTGSGKSRNGKRPVCRNSSSSFIRMKSGNHRRLPHISLSGFNKKIGTDLPIPKTL
ncbi:MAG: DUF72 domain-containing protein [Pirellulales bacterium]